MIYNLCMRRKKLISVDPCFKIFYYHKAKDNAKYFFATWFSDHALLVKNDQQWKDISNDI